MKIKLIRNEGCHIWQTAEAVLKEALAQANLPPEYEIVVVADDTQAQQYRFFGSPQITVNGVDIDPNAQKATKFQEAGCRLYLWQGKMYEHPPKEMILGALWKSEKAS